MTIWKKMIGRCFGLEDRAFAEHPGDEQEAFALLGELRAHGVGWAEFERELRRQLNRMPELDTGDQVRLVRSYFRPWMLD